MYHTGFLDAKAEVFMRTLLFKQWGAGRGGVWFSLGLHTTHVLHKTEVDVDCTLTTKIRQRIC